jgi:hypothetical protein
MKSEPSREMADEVRVATSTPRSRSPVSAAMATNGNKTAKRRARVSRYPKEVGVFGVKVS